MITIDEEIFYKAMKHIDRRFDKIDEKIDRSNRVKECMDGERWLDNQDLYTMLGIAPRTLADYRKRGLITYYQPVPGGRCRYKLSDVKEFIERYGSKLNLKQAVL